MTHYEALFRTVEGRELLRVLQHYIEALQPGKRHGVPLLTVVHDLHEITGEHYPPRQVADCLEHLWICGDVAAVTRRGGMGPFLYWYRY